MGGDSPLDIQSDFEAEFARKRPNPTDAVALIERIIAGGEEDHLAKQVVGFLMIDRKAPMSDALRTLVLEGIDEEDPEEIGWSDVESRKQKLADFRKIVVAYPTAGGAVEMPNQPGLMETILKGQANA